MIRLKDILSKSNTIQEQIPGIAFLKKAKEIVIDPVVDFVSADIKFSTKAQADIDSNRISKALLQDLQTAIDNTESVSNVFISSGFRPDDKDSRHSKGNALDVAMVNGKKWTSKAVAADNEILQPIEDLVTTLKQMGYTVNTEKGHPKALLYFGFDDHEDHIHLSNTTDTPTQFKFVDTSKQDIHQTIYTIGSTGPEVKKLQKQLINLGYDLRGEKNINVYGINTLTAITKFQEFIFSDPDKQTGVSNTETLEALYNLSKTQENEILKLNTGEDETEKEIEKYEIDIDKTFVKRSIPTDGNGTALIIWGGYPNSKFGPNYLEKYMPTAVKNNKVIIYAQGDSSSTDLYKLWNMIPENVKLDSLIGFSSGGEIVWKFHDDKRFLFIGLIDPVTPKKYANIELTPRCAMWARPENWPDSNKITRESLKQIIENNPNRNIRQEFNHLTEIFPYFLQEHLNDIILADGQAINP